ncbi:MAG: ParB/RepB/Spo0J family partition protein [archaeon]
MAIKNENILGRSDVYQINPKGIVIKDGWNPRKVFGDDQDKELRDSIITNGVKMPITVRKEKDNTIRLIDGERRLRAVRDALANGYEVESVPCIFIKKTVSDTDALIHSLIANTGKPLNAVEEAEAFKRLKDEGVHVQEIANTFGKSIPHVYNRVRLADASDEIKQKILNKEITIDNAMAIIDEVGKDEESQNKVACTSGKKSRSKYQKVYADEVANEVAEEFGIEDVGKLEDVLSKYNIRIKVDQ